MIRITTEMVMAAEPCKEYTYEKVRKLAGPGGLTPLELLNLDIPAKDKCWVFLNVVSHIESEAWDQGTKEARKKVCEKTSQVWERARNKMWKVWETAFLDAVTNYYNVEGVKIE